MGGVKDGEWRKIAGGVGIALIPILSAVPYLVIMAQLESGGGFPLQFLRVFIVAALLLPSIITTEGGYLMVGLGLLFYILRKWRWAQVAVLAAVSAVLFIRGGDATNQWLMVLAAAPMFMYNGEKGSGMKWFFYIFYPAHIIGLYVVSTLLMMYWH
ncbi:MAG: conjugal transfer protein TraX [Oscillospiraceae bacterium]|nr:conjugal transfer protein TraX [Oscillospiraceae bacterium]